MGWQEIVIDIVRQNWSKLRPVPIPKETFRIVEDHTYPAWWHMGKQNDQPATQISARYFVTNIALGKALITGCKLNLVGSDEAYHLRHLVRQMKFKDENFKLYHDNIALVHKLKNSIISHYNFFVQFLS